MPLGGRRTGKSITSFQFCERFFWPGLPEKEREREMPSVCWIPGMVWPRKARSECHSYIGCVPSYPQTQECQARTVVPIDT